MSRTRIQEDYFQQHKEEIISLIEKFATTENHDEIVKSFQQARYHLGLCGYEVALGVDRGLGKVQIALYKPSMNEEAVLGVMAGRFLNRTKKRPKSRPKKEINNEL